MRSHVCAYTYKSSSDRLKTTTGKYLSQPCIALYQIVHWQDDLYLHSHLETSAKCESSSYLTNTFYSLACWTWFYLHVNFDEPRPSQPISSQASRLFLPPLTLLRFTPSPSLSRARWFIYMDTSTYLYIWTPFHGLYLAATQPELPTPPFTRNDREQFFQLDTQPNFLCTLDHATLLVTLESSALGTTNQLPPC